MTNRNLLFLKLFIVLTFNCYSQGENFVINGDFELYIEKPITWGEFYKLKNWISYTEKKWSAVNYFYSDHGYIPSLKEGGEQMPYSGNGFVGIGLYLNDNIEYGSQIIETKLIKPLMKDSIYIISAFVSLADIMNHGIDCIPISLTSKSLIKSNIQNITHAEVIKLKGTTDFLTNKKDWMEVKVEYKAKGEELYLLLGGIYGNTRVNVSSFKYKKIATDYKIKSFLTRKVTYYFIDKVSIIQKPNPGNVFIKDTILEKAIPIEKKVLINDVMFESNSSVLNIGNSHTLDSLCNTLKSQNNIFIKILGYTDNIGSIEYNLKLSVNRAKAVYLYLVGCGVNESFIEYGGRGEENPIFSNNNPLGQKGNRRVEVLVKYK